MVKSVLTDNINKGYKMYNLELKVSDNVYSHLIYFLSNLQDDIEIINDKFISKVDDFKIDENLLLEDIKLIKNNDLSEFQKVTPEQLFKDLGI
jgi:hypothetical protein